MLGSFYLEGLFVNGNVWIHVVFYPPTQQSFNQ